MAASGQVLLDRMELLHPELQVQPGEDGVVKALTAANMAQDYFESVLALHPQAFGDSVGIVTTTPGSETTPFPLDVLRVDALWRLDAAGRPLHPIDLVQQAGAHLPATEWPASLATVTFGVPMEAWTNGRSFYWSPLPQAAYAVRWYGLQQQPDITVAGIITYPDICLTPLATFAAKLIRIGLDDSAAQLDTLADALFTPVVAAMKGFRRDRPQTLTYSRQHVT
jgi:hypothetical protein